MGVAIQEATPIVLTAKGRITVEGWVRSSKAERRLVERARVMLLAAAVEFPDFINQVVAGCPDQGIHVVLDNLSTPKPSAIDGSPCTS
jgi:phosphoribosylformimino-5-aminoimidazole carboxamide ribonucleotide (ProFAR) isomerase